MWVNKFNREAYDKRKEQGLCVQCGAVSDGHARCKRCRLKSAESARKSYMKKKGSDGIGLKTQDTATQSSHCVSQ